MMGQAAKVNSREVKFLRSGRGDWIGIYVDGQLVREGHELMPDEVLNALMIRYEEVTTDFAHNLLSGCPATWAEVESKLGLRSGEVKKG